MAPWTCDLVGAIAFPATTLAMQYREGHMTEDADNGRLWKAPSFRDFNAVQEHV